MAKLSPERLNNYLTGILTTVSIALLGFVWNVNSTMVKLEQKDSDRETKINIIESKIDKLDDNEQQDRINVARVASKVDDIQYMLNNKKFGK